MAECCEASLGHSPPIFPPQNFRVIESQMMSSILSPEMVRCVAEPCSREQAIDLVGGMLVDAGAVQPGYVSAMHEREATVSTYMGNYLAIPHGTNEGRGLINHSGLAIVRLDRATDWGGNPVRFVIGIAGVGDEHMSLLGHIALVFSDAGAVERLLAAPDVTAVYRALAGVAS